MEWIILGTLVGFMFLILIITFLLLFILLPSNSSNNSNNDKDVSLFADEVVSGEVSKEVKDENTENIENAEDVGNKANKDKEIVDNAENEENGENEGNVENEGNGENDETVKKEACGTCDTAVKLLYSYTLSTDVLFMPEGNKDFIDIGHLKSDDEAVQTEGTGFLLPNLSENTEMYHFILSFLLQKEEALQIQLSKDEEICLQFKIGECGDKSEEKDTGCEETFSIKSKIDVNTILPFQIKHKEGRKYSLYVKSDKKVLLKDVKLQCLEYA